MKNFKNIGGNYFNKYESKNILIKYIVNKFKKQINEFIKKIKPNKVIDIGCGEGYITSYIKENNYLEIDGIDIEEDVINKARSLNKKIKFSIGSAYETKKGANSYDCVIMNEVLEHLENPEKAILEIKRITKKYAIISVPNEPYWRMANITRLKYIKDLGNSPGHINHWTTNKFTKLLKKHFKKVTVKTSSLWNIALCEK